jgi:hypothetical protein
VPVYKNDDKTDCSNGGISPLLITDNVFSNTRFPRLTSYIDEIIGDHQCPFCLIRSTIHQIFCICQILGKNGSTTEQYIIYRLREGLWLSEDKSIA